MTLPGRGTEAPPGQRQLAALAASTWWSDASLKSAATLR